MKVVLDSNILYNHRFGQGQYLEKLFHEASQVGHEIYFPALVIEEVAHLYVEDLRKNYGLAEKALKQLSRGLGKTVTTSVTSQEVNAAEESFRARLEEAVKRCELTSLPYPDVTHQDLVKRAIAGKRPFAENGAGYRDTLIWETVLRLAVSEDELGLISSDGDFRGAGGNLHQDLVNDLLGRGLNSNAVRLFTSVAEFKEQHVAPHLESLNEFKEEIETGTAFEIDFEDEIALAVQDRYRGHEWTPEDLFLTWETESPTISMVEGVTDISVLDIRKLTSGEILAVVEATLDVAFDVYMLKADTYGLDADSEVHVWDWDWNDHGVMAGVSRSLRGEFDLIINSGHPASVLVEVNSLEPIEPSYY